jgi:hypothetical protein
MDFECCYYCIWFSHGWCEELDELVDEDGFCEEFEESEDADIG